MVRSVLSIPRAGSPPPQSSSTVPKVSGAASADLRWDGGAEDGIAVWCSFDSMLQGSTLTAGSSQPVKWPDRQVDGVSGGQTVRD